MELMYCPLCSNYLGSPSGFSDCCCGWMQSRGCDAEQCVDSYDDGYVNGYNNAILTVRSQLDSFLEEVSNIEIVRKRCKVGGSCFGVDECSKLMIDDVFKGLLTLDKYE